ncbi:MAG: MerR family transcriptional regulator [Dehalococcoidia bacterium]
MELSPMGVAAATDVTVHQLRLWERRYGFPAPARSANGRRLYRPEDVEAVRTMSRLIAAGVPGEVAARTARGGPAVKAPLSEGPGHGGLLAAVAAFDAARLSVLLSEAVGGKSPEAAFDTVIGPFLRAVGAAWESGDLSPAHEHLASQTTRRVFERLFQPRAHVANAPAPVVVACPAGEEHDLPAALLAATLEWHGRPATCLGGDLPVDSLIEVVRHVQPAAVCLIATADSSLPACRIAATAVVRSGTPLFVAGRALAAGTQPLPGERLTTFHDAVGVLVHQGSI